MLIKRFEDAEVYEAPNHWGVTGLRLQGFEDGGPENQWIGFSQFLPGGGAGPDSTPFEKVYVVLEGEMTIEWDGQTEVLGPMDSCTVPAGQVRRIENKSNHVCKMLVVIPYPEGGRPK
jgi:mannose-6-phosphate isomerase-like protein (cupin superfamily)